MIPKLLTEKCTCYFSHLIIIGQKQQWSLTPRAIVLTGGKRRNKEVTSTRLTWIEFSLTIWPAGFIYCEITRFNCKVDVKAVTLCQFQGFLKVVDVCSWELCSDVACWAAEDRIHKAFLLEEHTPVVRAFPSVVEWEDAGVLPASKVRP